MEKVKSFKEKKYYSSKRKEGERLYFSLEIEYTVVDYASMNENHRNIDISMIIKYLFVVNSSGRCERNSLNRQGNSWKIRSSFDNACTFENSIMIQPQYRSYGVGTIAINQLLLIAKQYIPEYSLSGFLSPVDAYEENFKRRDKLYRNVGFNINDDSFFIDKIDSLKIKNVIDGIEEVDFTHELSNMFEEKYNLKNTITGLEKSKENCWKINTELEDKTNKLWKYLIGSWIIFIFSLYMK
ncbi:hypothetical protein FJR45_06730 [Sulfurimonas sediminis]|uniref:Uncharacterized protein n=1 Tax=Sulfurimonas sediminis TaxID=2590020 RepID=A0A7M1B1Q0_9BACT|nr:hypothetical protein [Sulfurimonas sediminis]QOP43661.1 hypothetical protein FJR45_06730 [Sulfurimonas sediminis]